MNDLADISPYLLLVDDNADLREVLGALLKLKGYTVEVAGDGVQAFCSMKQNKNRPALVITDLHMPGEGGGWALRQNMLDDAELAAVPVAIMSAIIPIPTKESLHAIACLEKPVALASLLAVIEKYIELPTVSSSATPVEVPWATAS